MALTRDVVFWNAFTAHAQCTVRAAHMLLEMLEHPVEAQRLAREITGLEAEGDRITRDTVLALHRTWITPLSREEIHSLISKLDDVLDYVEAASDRIALYEIQAPTPESLELARVLFDCAADVARAVAALPRIRQAEPLLALCLAINDHERRADEIYRRGLARLFKETKDPLDVIKWRDVYDALETATDRAEDVANIIEGIVLEHA